jgi:hypothetical protein
MSLERPAARRTKVRDELAKDRLTVQAAESYNGAIMWLEQLVAPGFSIISQREHLR